jgi:NADPH2:quinone reductase
VLLRVQAVGVNPVETYIRSGNYGKLPDLPYTPGTDAAGIIEAVGERVTDLSVGDRVYTFGTLTGAYAELALCEPSQVHPLPVTSAFAEGAALGVAGATAWRALFQKGKAQAGEFVLIHGATGGVGSTAVQLGRAAGLKLVGTGGTEEGRKRARELGAHLVLDHHDEGYLEKAKAFTGGRGFDLIVEFLANVNLGRDFSVLAPFGRIVVVGSRGTVEIDPRQLMSRDGTVSGMSLFNASQGELAVVHAALFAALESGTLKPLIDKQLPLAKAPDAHRAVSDAGSHGKVILVP